MKVFTGANNGEGYVGWAHRLVVFAQDVPGVSDLLKAVSSNKGELDETTFQTLHAKAKASSSKLLDLKTLNKELHGLLTKVTDGTAGVLMRAYEGNGLEG